MPIVRHSNWAVKLMICITACIAVIVSVAYCAARFEQNRADRLIGLLSNVMPGVTSQESIKTMFESKSFLTGNSNVCQKYHMRNCDQFVFTNKLLAFLHIASSKQVWVTLDYRNGVVVSKSVQFAEDPRIGAVTRQLLRDIGPLPVGAATSSRTITVAIADSQNAIVKVYDDESVSTDQRQRDWQVDLSCLSRIGACSDPRVILPGAFPRD